MGWRLAFGTAAACWLGAGIAAAASVAVSDVKAEVKTSTVGASKGKDYLRVTYTAHVSDAVEKLTTVQVKASCKAGDQSLSDSYGLGPKLDALEKGASKPGSAPLFMKEGLPAKPSQCTLSFALGKPTARGAATPLQDFCWDGASAKEGACK
jgi:hypothetical protein